MYISNYFLPNLWAKFRDTHLLIKIPLYILPWFNPLNRTKSIEKGRYVHTFFSCTLVIIGTNLWAQFEESNVTSKFALNSRIARMDYNLGHAVHFPVINLLFISAINLSLKLLPWENINDKEQVVHLYTNITVIRTLKRRSMFP